MDAAVLISTNADRETVTLIRASQPVLGVDGVFVPAAEVESSLVVVTHPITGEDAEHVPEADRAKALIEIYATEALRVTRGDDAADRIRRADGRTYRVVKVDEQKGGAWLAFAALEGETV